MEPEQQIVAVKETRGEAAWMVILYIAFLTTNTLCFAILGAFVGKIWANLTATDRFLTLVAIIGSWTTNMMAFFSKSFARWSEGKSIIPLNGGEARRRGDTDLIKKEHK